MGSNAICDDPRLHVVAVRQAQVLLGRDVAQQRGAWECQAEGWQGCWGGCKLLYGRAGDVEARCLHSNLILQEGGLLHHSFCAPFASRAASLSWPVYADPLTQCANGGGPDGRCDVVVPRSHVCCQWALPGQPTNQLRQAAALIQDL